LAVADAPYCENQAPVPAGDGCGDELYSWFEPPKLNEHENESRGHTKGELCVANRDHCQRFGIILP